jgi:signal transduction histidine kinase
MKVNHLNLNNYMEIFHSSGFFKNLSSQTLTKLMAHVELKSYEAEEVLLTEDQENHDLYFLLEGFLGVFVHGEKVSELSRFGEVFGEISLINAIKTSATIKAEKKSIVLLCKLSQLKKESSEAIKEFEASEFKLFSAILAERLVVTNEKARGFEIANKELTEAKKQLEKSNQELEKRVLERTAELADKNMKLEAAVIENQQLVRVLCHDLNNTLSVVQLTSSRAVKIFDQLTPTQQLDFWKRVQRAALKERDLISYVRELTALESGKKNIQLTPVTLLDVIESSKFVFHEKLLEKELALIEHIPSQVKVMAEVVSLTHSVINNLISNAIKFSPRGKKIEVIGSPLGENKYQLLVKDEGIGIPKESLSDLFSMNKKTSRVGTEGESGTGFGMPLVLATMHAYGGSIEVDSCSIDDLNHDSNKSSGTTFKLIFNLPN